MSDDKTFQLVNHFQNQIHYNYTSLTLSLMLRLTLHMYANSLFASCLPMSLVWHMQWPIQGGGGGLAFIIFYALAYMSRRPYHPVIAVCPIFHTKGPPLRKILDLRLICIWAMPMAMAMPVLSRRLSLRVIYLMDALCILFTHFTVLYILYYLLKCLYIAIIILYTNLHFQMYYLNIVLIIICNKNIVS